MIYAYENLARATITCTPTRGGLLVRGELVVIRAK